MNMEKYDRAVLFDAILDFLIQFENIVKVIGYENIYQIESILMPYSPDYELNELNELKNI